MICCIQRGNIQTMPLVIFSLFLFRNLSRTENQSQNLKYKQSKSRNNTDLIHVHHCLYKPL